MKGKFFAAVLCLFLSVASVCSVSTTGSETSAAPCFIFDDLTECY